MQVHDLGHFGGGGRQGLRAMAALVAQIGQPDFDSTLFSLAHELLAADHVTAFCATPQGIIRTVIAENKGPRPIARTVAERYVRTHWMSDPVLRLLTEAPDRSRPANIIVDTNARDVADTAYRHECYAAVNLDHRLSVVEARDGHVMRLNFYRRRGHDFRDEDIDCLAQMADLLLALVQRHDAESCPRSEPDPELQFRERLVAIAPTLTAREQQVCALIALGLTSEGISLRLNIGLNSVLTYRKRAYARLGISSQNELMRRLMM
ncbi:MULTISPECIES: helix-turn-helix transcriptional regulator [unclassified Beijerinckia]|uniref:helix-turn-helix transcriptional regulator n=1 Tax=unclassified Beijerinckia TaxID=2638183 RepID=UPI00089689B9|nr:MULTISPECIES: helix-turn-helix transcriptional regulator [unclassified Beijerinckia]MDH7795833.1 DNA-binding CsgD family transcriptional regulator [Beijerinckia sp. GAS462]SEC18339.1 DNA-binding transcriptional regulator, CsgD family [Beijerinckia sp. 28-YEA-48]